MAKPTTQATIKVHPVKLEITAYVEGNLPTLEDIRKTLSSKQIQISSVVNGELWACPHCKSTNVRITEDTYYDNTYDIGHGGAYGVCNDRSCEEDYNNGEDMELINIAERLK